MMGWQLAPLYIMAHDLAHWIDDRATRRADGARDDLLGVLAKTARELLVAISLALTFPADRAAHFRCADESVVTIRVLARLARDSKRLNSAQLRFVASSLDQIGRMIGGWRRTSPRRTRKNTGNKESQV